MIAGKTAALIACSASLGSMVGGAVAKIVEQYRVFGEALGMGFQIMDDILGIWGNPQVTGKPVGDDLRVRKKTLPVIHAMLEQKRKGSSQLKKLYRKTEFTEADLDLMLTILGAMGSREYCLEQLAHCKETALGAIDAEGAGNDAHRALCDLALSILDRPY
jgi:geranylgeranyl diphosphate synthase type I